jgi:hypothetical protein
MQRYGRKCRDMAENAEIWPKMQSLCTKCRVYAQNAEFMHKMQSLCTKCRVYAQNAVFMTKGTLVRKYCHVPAVRDLLKSAWRGGSAVAVAAVAVPGFFSNNFSPFMAKFFLVKG